MRAVGLVCAGCLACVACAALVDLDGLHAGAGDAGVDASGDVGGDIGAQDGGLFFFFDDFNRADSTQIGNGWLTKLTAFDIKSDALARVDPNSQIGYRDNLVYRPEALANVRVSVEVRYGSFANAPYPQIHARIDPSTAATSDVLDSYLFFPTNGGTSGMSIARQHGNTQETILQGFAVNPSLDTSHVFRFTFSVTGTSPVTLDGQVEMLAGSSWLTIGSGSFADTDGTRLVQPGSFGLSASNGEQPGDYTYDNFTVVAL